MGGPTSRPPSKDFLRVDPERFAPRHGPLRPVVERVLRGFLTCGLVEHGFGRAERQTCHASDLIPFSCRGRSFCPSCEKKRQLLWAEWLCGELLSAVPHRPRLHHPPSAATADPLRCRSCGGTLRVVAYLSDLIAIRRVIEELGLSPPQKAKPPPAPSEVVRVPVDEAGREIAP